MQIKHSSIIAIKPEPEGEQVLQPSPTPLPRLACGSGDGTSTQSMPPANFVRWIALGGACPICTANADAGLIPMGEAFPSGDMMPPAHQKCRCSIEVIDTQRDPTSSVFYDF